MAEIGHATLPVIPSVRGLRKELDKQLGSVDAAGRKAGQRYGDTAGVEAGKGFKSRFGGFAKDAFAPLAAVGLGAGIVAGFTDVIGKASAAEQAVGGVRAVFGEYASQVEADSKRAADGLGLSSTAYQELITLSGALLKNKGIEDYSAQARGLVEVGADLAAQFGGTTREAMEALNAALRGESDPIERYAISLNETAVNAELARTGMSGLKGAALDQAKTQARLAIIQQQSADAMGAFGRESETLAGQQARLSADWENMKTTLGAELLPVTASFVGFLKDDAIPALSATGGAVKDAIGFFDSLPTPVKAATGALVAFRVAQASGLTSGLANLGGGFVRAFDDVRLRGMEAVSTYRSARTATIELGGASARYSPQVGRFASTLQAVGAASAGAGSALRKGLGGAVSMLGGPWGIALGVGAAALTKFWGEHREAKQHIEELTGSLDKQTGAITDNTRATIIDALEKDGLLKKAQGLGFGLGTVTDAALGNTRAMAVLRAEYDRAAADVVKYKDAGDGTLSGYVARRNAIDNLMDGLGGEAAALSGARSAAERKAAADRLAAGAAGESASANEGAASGYRTLADRTRDAKNRVVELLNAENARRDALVKNRRDQIALAQALADTRKEMREGKKTLDLNTQAGRDNSESLLNLADQWNNSSGKVRNAKGAYAEMRRQFIEVAEGMGASSRRARKLAEDLLALPKRAGSRIDLPGMDKALADAARLRNLLELDRRNQNVRRLGGLNLAGARADGGPVAGGKTYLVGERGPELFTARQSGHITPNHQMPAVNVQGGTPIHIGQVVAQDVNGMLRDLQRRQALSAYDGIPR